MSLVKTSSGKTVYRLSFSEWKSIGKEAKWLKTAAVVLPNPIDMNGRRVAIPPPIKTKINRALQTLGDHFEQIPLDTMFQILESNGLVALQEDGMKWAGMLIGGAECGSDQAQHQQAAFDLAIDRGQGWMLANSRLWISWCILTNHAKKYEVIKYLT